jgi:hypothetical protein
MKNNPLSFNVILFLILTFCAGTMCAQDGNITISQDPKFEQMLTEKRRVNPSITVNDRYKIQVYNGDSDTSKKTLIEFKKEYKNLDATIVFSTPMYKVWAGSFRSRIEAERMLTEVKKKYPNAFLIRPNK